MKILAGVAAIADAFRRFLLRFILPFLRSTFGQIQWTPPPWLRRAAGSLRNWSTAALNWLAARREANPARFWIATFAILTFIVGGAAGLRWSENLLAPHFLQVSIIPPCPTPL